MPADVDQPQEETAEVGASPPAAVHKLRGAAPNPPQSLAQKLGLPKLPPLNTNLSELIRYQRALTPDQRRCVTVRIYRLFPVIRQSDEHSIDVLPGETPLGGEQGSPEDALLAKHGAGNYFFIMQYQHETLGSKQLCRAFFMGYRDNIPGFSNFTTNPPLIGDVRTVVMDNDSNIKSGYLTYLRSQGRLPGEAQKENEDNMAEQQGNSSVVAAAVTGAFQMATKAMEKEAPQVQQPHPQPATTEGRSIDFAFEAIGKTVDKLNDLRKDETNNLPVLITAIKDLTKDTTTAPLIAQLSESNTVLQKAVMEMHKERADSTRAEMRELRAEMSTSMDRAFAFIKVQQDAAAARTQPPADDVYTNMAKQLMAKKLDQLLNDDEPRGRQTDEDFSPPVKPPSLMETLATSLLTNLPHLIQLGLGIVYGPQAVQQQQPQPNGMQYQPPPAQFPPTALPQPQPTNAAPSNQPPAAQGDNTAAMNMNAITQFITDLSPGLTAALEQRKTGFDYAETFIAQRGRLGEFGYDALCSMADVPQLNVPKDLPTPADRAARAIQTVIQYLNPPLWGRIGSSPLTHEFFVEFVTYDMFLRENDVTTITQLLVREGFDTLRDLLDADPEDSEGNTADDRDLAPAAVDPPPAVRKPQVPKQTAVPGMPIPPKDVQ